MGVGSPGTRVTSSCVLGARNLKLKASVKTVLLLPSGPSFSPCSSKFYSEGIVTASGLSISGEPNK